MTRMPPSESEGSTHSSTSGPICRRWMARCDVSTQTSSHAGSGKAASSRLPNMQSSSGRSVATPSDAHACANVIGKLSRRERSSITLVRSVFSAAFTLFALGKLLRSSQPRCSNNCSQDNWRQFGGAVCVLGVRINRCSACILSVGEERGGSSEKPTRDRDRVLDGI